MDGDCAGTAGGVEHFHQCCAVLFDPTHTGRDDKVVVRSARIGGSTNAGVLRLRLRMTARNKQQQQQKQIPYGNDKKKSKNNGNNKDKDCVAFYSYGFGFRMCLLRSGGHPPAVRPSFAHRRALSRESRRIGSRRLAADRRPRCLGVLLPLPQPHRAKS